MADVGKWWFGDYDGNGSVNWPYKRNDWAAGYTTHLEVCEVGGEAILMQHNNNGGGWHLGKYDGKGSVTWYKGNAWQAGTTTHCLFFLHGGRASAARGAQQAALTELNPPEVPGKRRSMEGQREIPEKGGRQAGSRAVQARA